MHKRNYEKPSLKVVMLQPCDLIATSDRDSVTFGLDLETVENGDAE